MTSRGIVYVAMGEKARREMVYPLAEASRYIPDIPVSVITDRQISGCHNILVDDSKSAGRMEKTMLHLLSPYDVTLYMDVDTRVKSADVIHLMDVVEYGFDVAMAMSSNQDDSVFYHVSQEERDLTIEEVWYRPIQWQAGVIAFRKNDGVYRLFCEWHNQWCRYADQDQAAFVRALHLNPVRMWVVGTPYNGGIVVSHDFGRLR